MADKDEVNVSHSTECSSRVLPPFVADGLNPDGLAPNLCYATNQVFPADAMANLQCLHDQCSSGALFIVEMRT